MLDINHCSHCQRNFLSYDSLVRHQNIYKIGFVYPCCNDPYIWKETFKKHNCFCRSEKELNISNKNGSASPRVTPIGKSDLDGGSQNVFNCDNCPSTFKRYQSIKKHVIKYDGFHNFVCKSCCKHFLSKKNLKKHPCFLVGGNFQCSCMAYFKTLQHFQNHVGTRRPYFCCACKAKSVTFNNLINHIRTHTKEKPFTCQVCKSAFRVKESLTAHMNIHSGIKSFHCSKCDYAATTKWNLQLHEKRHEANTVRKREYLCATCGSCFYLKHHLQRHIAAHSKESRHLCRVCGKLFSQGAYLERHLEKHSRECEKGQKCHLCSKELDKNDIYQHHKETGHFQFVCDSCEKVFMTKYNLQRHQRRHTK